tara:strand:- start:27 stop:500 length:474 start_codon:yes stop_codon:yes gene_type:complete
MGLSDQDRQTVIDYMINAQRRGMKYDLKNIIDLMRYLLPKPPVPKRFRRRMLALGSGDPTRTICSSLIAQAFQQVKYPILPNVRERSIYDSKQQQFVAREYLHIRHHSLFAPRDFDLSPYFRIVKPSLETNFNYKELEWYEDAAESDESDKGDGETC